MGRPSLSFPIKRPVCLDHWTTLYRSNGNPVLHHGCVLMPTVRSTVSDLFLLDGVGRSSVNPFLNGWGKDHSFYSNLTFLFCVLKRHLSLIYVGSSMLQWQPHLGHTFPHLRLLGIVTWISPPEAGAMCMYTHTHIHTCTHACIA